ncbi:MAG: sulfoxide reductase heme-binding subunit YedZ [Betaproteobacteria bacterium]|nr:MAG: sulfoxide reductase heme-binding subunit YedZ [Betaproteobacteria bacterium]TAG76691.1 MAG: sulfoxide reductase heme-binding subunit YedZ [Betaproteobacteria bacterium]
MALSVTFPLTVFAPWRSLTNAQVQRAKWVLVALGMLPLARMLIGLPLGWLGVNPIEFVTRSTGTWTIVSLVVTLSITPLRKITGWVWLVRLRRSAGLITFFYAALHFITYVWLDRFFDVNDIIKDIIKRPFITVGFAAFVLLIPLAITSNNALIKKLGAQNWQRLHNLVYVIAILAVVHFIWLARRNPIEPYIYAAIFALLFAARIYWRFKAK